jgi:hypothetical protein
MIFMINTRYIRSLKCHYCHLATQKMFVEGVVRRGPERGRVVD